LAGSLSFILFCERQNASTTAPFVSHWQQWSLDLLLVGRFNTQYIPESHMNFLCLWIDGNRLCES
jgi:hypothetical protein